MRKLMIFLICFSVFLSTVPVMAQEKEDCLIFYDFEDTKPFSANVVSSYYRADDEHKTVLKIETTKDINDGTARYAENYDVNISAKKIMWEFDALIFQNNNDFTFMVYNQEKRTIFQMQLDKSGKMYAWNYALTSKKVDIPVGEWSHMQFLFDFEKKTFETAVNGIYMDVLPMIEYDSTGISHAYMGVWRQGNNAKVYIDNMKFSDCSSLDSLKSLTNGENVDTYFDFETPRLGNIFFDNNISCTARLHNETDSKASYEVQTKIISESGKLLANETKEVTLDEKGSEELVISAIAEEYGFYNVYMTAKNKETGEITSKESQFSVAHARTDGRTNEIIGICDHVVNNKLGIDIMEERNELLQKAGISASREAYQWKDFEKSDGVYERHTLTWKFYDSLKRHNIKPFVIAGYTNPIVKNENPPVSPNAVDRFGKYAANMSLDIDSMTNDIEVFNEFNLVEGVTVDDYINMCKSVYEKTKAVNPDTMIYTLSGAALPSGSTLEKQREWVKECFEKGISQYSDGYTIHPYEFSDIPEKSPTFETVEYIYKLMEQYDKYDKPLVISEFGWPATNVGELNQANYTVRYLAMIGEMTDLICFYNFQCKEGTSASENSFGWIRQTTREGAGEYEPYSAKPVYLAVTNWNALMLGAKQQERLTTENSGDYLYKYKLEDGRDCIVAWNIGEDTQYRAYNLGAEKAEIYDTYGNKNTVYGHNGAINAELSNSPVYIIGSFSNFEEQESIVSPNKNKISSSSNESEVLYVGVNDEGFSYEFELPYNVTSETPYIQNGEMSVKLNFKEGNIGEEKVRMNVKNKDGKVISSNEFFVNFTNSASLELFPAYYRNGRWQIGINVKSNKKTQNISGNVEIENISGIFNENKKLSFSNLMPNQTEYFRINVPEFYSSIETPVNVTVTLDNNEVVTESETLYFSGIKKTNSTPIIDGNISLGEWEKSMPMSFENEEQVKSIKDYGGLDDLSGKAYCMYDDDNFYIAAEITDDKYCGEDSLNRLYACDSLQIAFAKERDSSALRTEYALGSLNGKEQAVRYAYLAIDTTINGVKDNQSYDDIKVAVTRDEEKKKTYYEASIPWTQIYGENMNPSSQRYLYFSILVNDNDGFGRRGWMEYGSGIGAVKNPELFIRVPMISAK